MGDYMSKEQLITCFQTIGDDKKLTKKTVPSCRVIEEFVAFYATYLDI